MVNCESVGQWPPNGWVSRSLRRLGRDTYVYAVVFIEDREAIPGHTQAHNYILE